MKHREKNAKNVEKQVKSILSKNHKKKNTLKFNIWNCINIWNPTNFSCTLLYFAPIKKNIFYVPNHNNYYLLPFRRYLLSLLWLSLIDNRYELLIILLLFIDGRRLGSFRRPNNKTIALPHPSPIFTILFVTRIVPLGREESNF